MSKKRVVVIGAGPAGLTAAFELQKSELYDVIVLESSCYVGGISKTLNYKGNRIDIGGHRFFSKSDRVMKWWQGILPVDGERPTATDRPGSLMLRKRLSRIHFEGQLFDYPLKPSFNTLSKFGWLLALRIIISYIISKLKPRKPEQNLEDFFVNRFGLELYSIFFRDYTQKVWGVSCQNISPSWGAQRIKSLSITSILLHALKSSFVSGRSALHGKAQQTSLIESFLYPKYGPGQMWETTADLFKKAGGKVILNCKADRLYLSNNQVHTVVTKNSEDSHEQIFIADYVISTMPVPELIRSFVPKAPEDILRVSDGLVFRDFVTVGLLLKRAPPDDIRDNHLFCGSLPDNWIYIQDREVKLGRLQIFNNWSPFLVADPLTAWVGLEYFCQEGDDFWTQTDADLISFGLEELVKIRLAEPHHLLDGVVIRTPKAYPGYFGSYENFSAVRNYVDAIDNLFLIGRNGMHRYNNQDHSMMTAFYAAEAIMHNKKSKEAIWNVNINDEYHEG
jgi:protoporphyrinogen oxidase